MVQIMSEKNNILKKRSFGSDNNSTMDEEAHSPNRSNERSSFYTNRNISNLTEYSEDEDSSAKEKAISLDDKISMVILLILYTLQGIPMGLCGSIPLIMKERGTCIMC